MIEGKMIKTTVLPFCPNCELVRILRDQRLHGCSDFVHQLRHVKLLDNISASWEIPTVHTLIVDSKKRVRLPHAEPNQVYAYELQGEGQFVLTRVAKAEPPETFPRGSLRKYLTRQKAKEELALLKGCSLETPE